MPPSSSARPSRWRFSWRSRWSSVSSYAGSRWLRPERRNLMSHPEFVSESAGSVPVVTRSDVVVVGGGPAGFAAAVAAKREGCSVTLIERYPYLGGLASGGMVLVLDDMNNGQEVTVTGLCMEMIERMAKIGAAVYPPPEERL